MNGIDWDSVPMADPPPGAVEVPRSGFGFLAVAGILELGVPNAAFRLPRQTGPGIPAESGENSKEIAACLSDSSIPGPADPLARCWCIVPPPSMPAEGSWEALDESEPLRRAEPGPAGRRDGLHVALQVPYSNS